MCIKNDVSEVNFKMILKCVDNILRQKQHKNPSMLCVFTTNEVLHLMRETLHMKGPFLVIDFQILDHNS